jgi:hypothetical protein
MEPEHEAHLAAIQKEFSELMDSKYRQGQAEHGGNLWERDPFWLLDQAIMESLDMVAYLLTLRGKLTAVAGMLR